MSWASKFIGRPYSQGRGDCLGFVHDVLVEQFGQTKLPPYQHQHEQWLEQARSVQSYAEPTTEMKDGFIAIFSPASAIVEHAGIVVVDGFYEPHLLHTHQRFGSSVLQPFRLASRWLRLVGIYDPFQK